MRSCKEKILFKFTNQINRRNLSIISDITWIFLALWSLCLPLVANQNTRDKTLATLEMFAWSVQNPCLNHFLYFFCTIFSVSNLILAVEVFFTLEESSWLLQKVKMRLEHDKATVGCFSDKFVFFKSESAVLLRVSPVFEQICWINGFYDIEFSSQLAMAKFM